MKIYQPMLFVGLGGTGGRIGSELERSLRRELCGPDGTDLVDGGRRLPFQLPDCLQFVYADFSEAELLQQPQFKAKGAEAAAFARTSRMVRDLLPTDFDSSSEVTRMLRTSIPEETGLWLPPKARQPRVAPQQRRRPAADRRARRALRDPAVRARTRAASAPRGHRIHRPGGGRPPAGRRRPDPGLRRVRRLLRGGRHRGRRSSTTSSISSGTSSATPGCPG